LESPDDYEAFAFVIEGDVALVFYPNKNYMQPYVEAWSANPKIVALSDEQKNVVKEGWIYNEETGSFAEPGE